MVVVTRDSRGRVRLHQSLPLAALGSTLGSLGGMVLGMMLLNPLFGSIAGAAVGAAAASFADIGIDDAFMKELGETLTPGTSALFVTVRKTTHEMFLELTEACAGSCKILKCNLPAEREALFRRLLEGEAARPQSTGSNP